MTEAIAPVAGVRLAAAAAGLYDGGRDDLALLELAPGAQTAAVFTRNRFFAAPILVAREHLAARRPAYLLVNAGNANAGTGARGIADARALCRALAGLANTEAAAVLPFSTGVIGEYLPREKIAACLPRLLAGLDAGRWRDCARAIMTTDTRPKCRSVRTSIDGKPVALTGIAKGAGMIRPDMATMLAFIATDAAVSGAALRRMLRHVVKRSFHRVCVDGDTSTNDACVLIATGRAGHRAMSAAHPQHDAFRAALQELCLRLAQDLVRDGEGATRFVELAIRGGRSERECDRLGFALATSPLVKTALYAADPNWGRILAVVGRADLAALDIRRVRIYLNDVCVVEDGGRAAAYTEERGQAAMRAREIVIRVELGRGRHNSQIWTCDLSPDYVRINADYRS